MITMDPSVIRELIKGQPDVISDEIKAENELYKNLSCPVCYESSGCEKRLRPPKILVSEAGVTLETSPFVTNRALPQGYAHCVHCGTDFDPRSGFIMKTEASTIAPVDVDSASTLIFPPSDPHLE